VVLRITVDALSQRGSAVRLKKCECIGLKISKKVNGESLSLELDSIFSQAGQPSGIIKDCDATLQKGLRLWSQQHEINVPVIEDIGHVLASALKSQFEKTADYNRFTSPTRQGANCLGHP
jgi:hypothetical protein